MRPGVGTPKPMQEQQRSTELGHRWVQLPLGLGAINEVFGTAHNVKLDAVAQTPGRGGAVARRTALILRMSPPTSPTAGCSARFRTPSYSRMGCTCPRWTLTAATPAS